MWQVESVVHSDLTVVTKELRNALQCRSSTKTVKLYQVMLSVLLYWFSGLLFPYAVRNSHHVIRSGSKFHAWRPVRGRNFVATYPKCVYVYSIFIMNSAQYLLGSHIWNPCRTFGILFFVLAVGRCRPLVLVGREVCLKVCKYGRNVKLQTHIHLMSR
jgi:hypothetical protein